MKNLTAFAVVAMLLLNALGPDSNVGGALASFFVWVASHHVGGRSLLRLVEEVWRAGLVPQRGHHDNGWRRRDCSLGGNHGHDI